MLYACNAPVFTVWYLCPVIYVNILMSLICLVTQREYTWSELWIESACMYLIGLCLGSVLMD